MTPPVMRSLPRRRTRVKTSAWFVLSFFLLLCFPNACYINATATTTAFPSLEQVEQAVSVLESIGATGYCIDSVSYKDVGIPPCDVSEDSHDDWFYLRNGLLAFTCVLVAALAAGLTMGLLSMDPLLLHIKIRAASSPEEKRQASQLLPIVKQHHLLLVSLLLLNSIANEALPLFLDSLVGSYLAVILSVTLVLFFGEIIPSALFTGPNQMAIGARLTPFVRIVMTLLCPIAYPIAKLLDCLLKDESDGAYNRGELSALVRIQYEERLATKQRRKLERSELALKQKSTIIEEEVSRDDFDADKRLSSIHVDEVSMVEGALSMKTKTANDVYTPLHRVFAIPSDMILTERNLVKIYSSGNSRIPVYRRQEKSPSNICNVEGVLISKQLIVVNKGDQRCVNTLPLYKPYCVSPNEDLVTLINKFQTGGTLVGGHMAMVCARPDLATAFLERDEPIPESAGLLGIITLEDVLEELIQEEIYDETDNLEQKHERIARWALAKWKLFVKKQKKKQVAESEDVKFVDVMERAMAREGIDYDLVQEAMPFNKADGLNYGGLV